MFISLFETMIGLMSLYSITTTTYNFHNMTYQKSTVSPVSVVDSGIKQEYSSVGSSVEFYWDDDDVTEFYNAGYRTDWNYRIYSQINNDNSFVRAGSISFGASLEDNGFSINVYTSAVDIFNLHTYLYFEFTNSNGVVDYKNVFINWHYTYNMDYTYSVSSTLLTTNYFSNEYEIHLIIMNVPVNDEQWYNEDFSYEEAYNDGYTDGHTAGFVDGVDYADNQNGTALTIFSGIMQIGLLPVNFFLAVLNFEVFGINIGAFVSALLTVAIIVIVSRMVINGGNGSGGTK